MKKLFVFAITLVIFAGTITAHAGKFSARLSDKLVKINRNDKAAFSKTFIMAILDRDVETIWQMIDPELIKKSGQNGYSKEDFTRDLLKEINLDELTKSMEMPKDDAIKFMKAVINSDVDILWKHLPPELQKEAIKEAGSESKAKEELKKELPELCKELYRELDDILIQRNGKWYVYFNDDDKKPVTKQSTQDEAVESFFIAMAYGNIEMLWDLLCPANKEMIIKEAGSKSKALEVLKTSLNVKADPEGQKRLKDQAAKTKMINEAKTELSQKKAWVYVDGKWYIDFTK